MSDSQLLGAKISINQSQVARDQRALNILLDANLKVDGISGDLTKDAIKRFQEQNGLDKDGIIGPDTRKVLNKKLQEHFQSNKSDKEAASKVSVFIESLLDSLDSTFNNSLFKILSCLETGSLENSHRYNSSSLRNLYQRALHQRDYYEKFIKRIPDNLKNIQKQINSARNPIDKQRLTNNYKAAHQRHIVSSTRQIQTAKNSLDVLDKTKNIGALFKETLPKVQTFFKPFGRVFKVLSWAEISTDLIKGIKYFFCGNINEGFHYLNKTFTKILEIAISIYLTELAVAGTVALCATAGVGAVGTMIAVLAVVLVIALLLMAISTIWGKFTDYYYTNL